ncbi:WD domain, G-beta repeat protein (macronuclear) [Tetrahymena thermophila SB210]|uniref:WD domain, G-beta repeat protein n=1 Tax=Tetrahymena thermophila (strain SB210) TaxID=312017 RepID=I7LVI6_TETTS|nr:WD domain, G-beta repeat protein [Tetrahymena thermophila SB210]EAR98303.2 WD domain, G-beta repeat protein [Tetrahymena thermophila SB210]|eukprot:XP_001018548.2 WD domain, G-beta repeat protein [Tetrahymena thermophila SB210]
MSEQIEQSSSTINQDINILQKTQNVQLNSSWVYDCIFTNIKNGLIDKNKYNQERLQIDNNQEGNKQNYSNVYQVLATTRKGKLFQFDKCEDGSIQNQKTIYTSPINEEFYRLYEDYDTIDYQRRYLLVSGSRKKVHVFKLQNNDRQSNNQQNQDIQEDFSLYHKFEYIPAPERNVYSLSGYKKHSNKILSSGQSNITLYDLQHQKIQRRIKNNIENACIQYNRDYNFFFTCGTSKEIIAYEDRQNKQIFSLKGHESNVLRMANLKNNNQFLLASGSHDKSIILWDIKYQHNNKIIQNHHTNAIFGIDYDHINQIVYSTGWDKSIKALDIKSFKVIGNIQRAQQDNIITCRYNSQTQELMSSSRDGSIQFYKANIA